MRLRVIIFVSVALFVAASSNAFAAPSGSQVRSAARSSAIPPSGVAGSQAGLLVSNNSDPRSLSDGGSLPFTGLDLRFIVVAGAFLVLAGTAIRRHVRSGH